MVSKIIKFSLLIGLSSILQADFYVIPVVKKMQNVITVAKSGGEFTNVKSAIQSCVNEICYIHIAPGEYIVDEPIMMKSHVHLVGSGEGVTIIKGSLSGAVESSSSIIRAYDLSSISNLTVINEGGTSSYSFAIYVDGVSPNIENITAIAKNATSISAIKNVNGATPTISNVTAQALFDAEGNYCSGIYNSSDSISTITNVTAEGTGCLVENNGIKTYGAIANIKGAIATATGGERAYGIRTSDSDSGTLEYVVATATGGDESYGAYIQRSDVPIRYSRLEGTNGGISLGEVTLSTVIGGGTSTIDCSYCVDENGAELDATCNLPD